MEQLYFVKYKSGLKGCPNYVGGKDLKDDEWTNEHEWDYQNPDPFKYEVKSTYGLKMDESYLNLDYSERFVSNIFLDLLDELKIKYRAIPLDIILKNDEIPDKQYFILLLVGRYFLLDEERSKFNLAYDLNTKELISSKVDPSKPVYDVIEEFNIKNIKIPHFFICQEISQVMCTQTFKELAIRRNILGIDFVKVEDGFTYDPWEGL